MSTKRTSRIGKIVSGARSRFQNLEHILRNLRKQAQKHNRKSRDRKRNIRDAIALVLTIAFFALYHAGYFYYITETTQSIYDVASQIEACQQVVWRPMSPINTCVTRRTIWLRLDPDFYRRGTNYGLSASHRKLAMLLSVVAREHPKVVVLDVGGNKEANPKKDDPLRSFFRNVARASCEDSNCTTWILVSSVRADRAGGQPRRWGSSLAAPAVIAESKGRILSASSLALTGIYSGYQRSVAIAMRCNNSSESGSSVRYNAAWLAAAAIDGRKNVILRSLIEEQRVLPSQSKCQIQKNGINSSRTTERVFYHWRESSMCEKGDACLDASGVLEDGATPRVLKPLVDAGVFIGPGLNSAGAIGDIHASPLGLMSGTMLLLNAYHTFRAGGVKNPLVQYVLIAILGLLSVIFAEEKNKENVTLAASWLLSLITVAFAGELFLYNIYIDFGFLFATVAVSSASTAIVKSLPMLNSVSKEE